jgi:hypothetical protein
MPAAKDVEAPAVADNGPFGISLVDITQKNEVCFGMGGRFRAG